MIKTLLLSLATICSSAALAYPTLQLGIGGGSYDSGTETIVTNSTQFNLYAYAEAEGNNAIDLNDLFYVAVAITPFSGATPVDFGNFSVNGATYNFNSPEVVFGNPPFEMLDAHNKDPHDLGSHGIYDTFFMEVGFTFSDLLLTTSINTQNNPGNIPVTTSNGSHYYIAFNIDASGLFDGYNLHFDLYNEKLKSNGDIDVDTFAPFSHDAGTTNLVHTVPEPAPMTLLIFGSLLLALGQIKKEQKLQTELP